MKTNSQIKMRTIMLSLLILSQSCTVYKSANVSLDQAVNKEVKTKIVTTTGQRLKFKRIAIENGNYFGIKKSNGDLMKIPLKNDEIKNIHLKDNTMSTILTIALPVGFIIITAVLIEDSLDSLEWDTTSSTGY